MHKERVDESLPTRLSLLTRLKDWDDNKSWRRFFDTYWKLIYGAAIRSGLSDAEAQDVVQETVISVAKKIHEFKYDPAIGSFKGWLLTLTRWRIADHFRKNRRHAQAQGKTSEDTTRTSAIEALPDEANGSLEAIWDAEWQKNLMDAAIDRVKRKVNPRQYQLFDLYVIKQWPVEDLIETFQVSADQVYQAKSRVSALIRKELQSLETKFI
jgi:RNA polymerase sigma-70 factor (ECF subfamily)